MNLKKLVLALSLTMAACAPQNEQLSLDAQSDNAIVGGEKVARLSPIGRHTVGLYESKIGYICSGTLIAPNLVLTAAHCIDPQAKNLAVVFDTEIKKASKDRTRAVVDYRINPLWLTNQNEVRNTGDIAVLRFEGRAPAGYEPAPLLGDSQYLRNGATSTMAGYGLSWTFVIGAGSGTLRSTNLKIDDNNFSETEVMIGQSVKRGICSGDSGGPAYMQINGRLHVWGVASRGDSIPLLLAPKCMLFSVFTRVDVYQDWILQASAELLNQ